MGKPCTFRYALYVNRILYVGHMRICIVLHVMLEEPYQCCNHMGKFVSVHMRSNG